ncbi:MAG: hypothetical protein KGR26_04800, partial [Cyanobacteria bacterium REEB65]|nr:hypothetical protein [Cyanobacteria bacterium REEB65]
AYGVAGLLLAGCGTTPGIDSLSGADQGLSLGAQASSNDSNDFFPMNNADLWTYQASFTENGVTKSAHYSLGWMTVATTPDGVTHGVEIVTGTDPGASGSAYIPYSKSTAEVDMVSSAPIEMLALPPKVGTAWDPQVAAGSMGQPHMVIAAQETVTVPAGTFANAYRVDLSFASTKGKVVSETWYAPGVGEVKQASLKLDGTVAGETELMSFKAASPAATSALSSGGSNWQISGAFSATDGPYTIMNFDLQTPSGESNLNVRVNTSDSKDVEVWQDGKMIAPSNYAQVADELASARLANPGDQAVVESAIAALRAQG